MAESNTNSKRPSFVRFSIGAMLIAITCLCCFLGGERYGYQRGLKRWNSIPVYTTAYAIPDISAFEVDDVDSLVAKIKSEVVPDAWTEAGGNCSCGAAKPIGGKKPTLVVSANVYVHNQLSSLFVNARENYERQQAISNEAADYPTTQSTPILGRAASDDTKR